jgi:fatty acid desaturase
VLRESSDRRTLVFIGAYFVSVAAVFAVDFTQWWVWLLCCAWLCVLSFICATITHNTVHHPIFESKRANKLFQIVLTLAYGHPVSAYVPGHNLSHHMHAQTAKDSIRTSKLRFRWNLLNQLFFLPVVAPSIMAGEREYLRTMFRERPSWFRQWVVEGIVFLSVSIGLFVIDWRKGLVFWMVPHLYAVWGIVGINFAQHDGCDEDHPYNHARNFVGGFVNWLLFNNGYHAIHHEKPNLHWSRLPEAHEREIAPHNHPALDQPNMLKYFIRAYIWPGRRLRYDGKPVELEPKREDESWIPKNGKHPDEVSLGAGA